MLSFLSSLGKTWRIYFRNKDKKCRNNIAGLDALIGRAIGYTQDECFTFVNHFQSTRRKKEVKFFSWRHGDIFGDCSMYSECTKHETSSADYNGGKADTYILTNGMCHHILF